MPQLLETSEQRIREWLTGDYDEETKKALQALLKEDPQTAIDAFQSQLKFGTGGLRAPVGLGTARFNLYTIRMLTQGLANFLIKKYPDKTLSVIIGYDCRVDSLPFAQAAAEVLLGNEITVYLFKELRPTPVVSFGCRLLGCQAGVMITASHNPPQDNGYKVYSAYGGQIAPPEDQDLIDSMQQVTSLKQIKHASLDSPLLHLVSKEMDEQHLNFCEKNALDPLLNKAEGSKLHIVYSNLHGTGGTLIPLLLNRCGFSHVTEVSSQAMPDGTFPTVTTANPENPAAMQKGMEMLASVKGDLLLATDPDADRVGVGVKEDLTARAPAHLLTGNQVACLCLDFICASLQGQNRLPKTGVCLKTVVTTPLFSAIANDYGVSCVECLPGSKYMSQQIQAWKEDKESPPTFLFGAEDSCGYLFGSESREKDAVLASLLIAEAALGAKRQGITLYQKLLALYMRYGVHRERTLSWHFPANQQGQSQRNQVMTLLRENPPKELASRPILSMRDFSQELLPANLLYFQLEGAWVAVRPSGTEPKIKVYVGCIKPFQENREPFKQILSADQELQQILKAICKLA